MNIEALTWLLNIEALTWLLNIEALTWLLNNTTSVDPIHFSWTANICLFKKKVALIKFWGVLCEIEAKVGRGA